MDARKLIAIILLVAGTLGLIYGGFSYTKETHDAKVGPLYFSVKENETIYIPLWLSAAAIGIGGLLLVVGRKRL